MTDWNPLLAMRAAMRSSEGLDRTERDALLVIIDRQPNCSPSVQQFAAEAKVHRATLIEAIARLEAKGVITVDRSPGRGSRYRLTDDWQDRITSRLTRPVASHDQSPQTTTPVASHDKTGRLTRHKERKDTNKKAIPSEPFAFATAPADDSPPPSTSNAKTSKGSKRRRKAKSADDGPPDPRVQVAIDAFAAEYQSQVGHAPGGADYGHAGKLIRKLPKSVSADDICDAVRLQLGPRRLHAYKGKDWNTLSQIVANIDTIRAWVPNGGPAKAAPPPTAGERAPRIIRTRADLQ